MREILLGYQDHIASAAIFEQGQLCAFLQEQAASAVQKEQIYRVRVVECAKSMEAVFAVLPDGQKVFVEQCRGISGNSLLVQIKRRASGEKLPLATTELSLPGHFCVIHASTSVVSISRKITDAAEIARLRQIGNQMANGTFGITFRTAAKGAPQAEVEAEISRLYAALERILEQGKQDGGPELLYAGVPFWQRVMREYLDDSVEQVLVDGAALYSRLKEILGAFYHKQICTRFRLHTGEYPLFSLYHVETELRRAFSRTVWLKSGAYLVIDPTEAMTVIDVNSGKYSKRKEFDSMASAVNLEAAAEIARLVRLRNIRGIIIIDFLKRSGHEEDAVFLQTFREYLKEDKGKTEVVDMTGLGLVELTRREE